VYLSNTKQENTEWNDEYTDDYRRETYIDQFGYYSKNGTPNN